MTTTKNDDPEKVPKDLLNEFKSYLDNKDKENKNSIIEIGQSLEVGGVPKDKVGVVLDDYLKDFVYKETGKRIFTRTWIRQHTPRKWWSS